MAFAGTRLILHFAFPSTAGLGAVPISASLSLRVLLFAFSASLVTGIVFGIAPAWMPTRLDPIVALRGGPLDPKCRFASAEDASCLSGCALACVAVDVGTAYGRAAQTGK